MCVWSLHRIVLGSGDSALLLQEKAPTIARPLGFSLVPPSLGSAIRTLAPFLLIYNVPAVGNELLLRLRLAGMFPNQGKGFQPISAATVRAPIGFSGGLMVMYDTFLEIPPFKNPLLFPSVPSPAFGMNSMP